MAPSSVCTRLGCFAGICRKTTREGADGLWRRATGAGECLYRAPLKWYGGRDSEIFRRRPLPLAAKPDCIFLPVARAALEGARVSWETPYQANDWRDLVAFVSAGLAAETIMP